MSLDEAILEMLDYDPATGFFTWTDAAYHRVAGKPAGTFKGSNGYRSITLLGRRLLAHRIAWFIYYGCWPRRGLEVDHINGDPLDNRICNLRLASHRENMANQRAQSKKKYSALKGVTYCKREGRWSAVLTSNGKRVWLGRHDTPEQAHEAYTAAAEKYFGEFAKS